MINLLPEDVKQNIAYARRNTKLLHWITALLLGVVGVMIVVAFGLVYINQSITSYSSQVALSQQQLQTEKVDETQKQLEDITASLKLVVQVLSKEVLFSKLLTQVGAAMPQGSALTSLNISKVQGGIDLQAAATDYQTATQVQVNLQDPNNKIFDKADIIQIQCNAASGSSQLSSRYPCAVSIRAQFAKNNNPFLFINNTPTTGTKP